jgi:hypothetical protein
MMANGIAWVAKSAWVGWPLRRRAMDKAALLTLFRCLVPLTWALFVPAFALTASTGKGAARVLVVFVLLASMAALAVVTIDAMRAGVWG